MLCFRGSKEESCSLGGRLYCYLLELWLTETKSVVFFLILHHTWSGMNFTFTLGHLLHTILWIYCMRWRLSQCPPLKSTHTLFACMFGPRYWMLFWLSQMNCIFVNDFIKKLSFYVKCKLWFHPSSRKILKYTRTLHSLNSTKQQSCTSQKEIQKQKAWYIVCLEILLKLIFLFCSFFLPIFWKDHLQFGGKMSFDTWEMAIC